MFLFLYFFLPLPSQPSQFSAVSLFAEKLNLLAANWPLLSGVRFLHFCNLTCNLAIGGLSIFQLPSTPSFSVADRFCCGAPFDTPFYLRTLRMCQSCLRQHLSKTLQDLISFFVRSNTHTRQIHVSSLNVYPVTTRNCLGCSGEQATQRRCRGKNGNSGR